MLDQNNSPIISVLMPVYNVKDYVAQSIESVLNQTFKDFELIILNDGSTDGSGSIIEEYAKKDSRIRIYHIENKGIANARNVLASYAKGQYITYIDSDDLIEDRYLNVLYENAVKYNADITICSHYKYIDELGEYHYYYLDNPDSVIKFTGVEAYNHIYDSKNAYNISLVVSWGKLYRRELFDAIAYPVGKSYEDSYTTYKLYMSTDNIVYINTPMYIYRIREGSIIVSSWSVEKVKNSIEQHEEKLALLTAAGVKVTQDNIDDYVGTLRNMLNISLQNGFVKEYKSIKFKLETIEKRRHLNEN